MGLDGVWLTMATSYVEGAVLRPSTGQLRMLGGALGRLHSVRLAGRLAEGAGPGSAGGAGRAMWYPEDAIPVTLARLNRVAGAGAAGLAGDVRLFRSTVLDVRSVVGSLPEGVVHGDAWAAKAVQTSPAQVILIDWECGGLGVPVLDLGNCLLECLLDRGPGRAGPGAWNVQPAEDRIAAVAAGYQSHRVLSAGEQAVLLPAVRFGPAYAGAIHFEQALADGVQGRPWTSGWSGCGTGSR